MSGQEAGSIGSSESTSAKRTEFERRVAGLVNRRITAVQYWDIHNYADEPRAWDHGDWHHAVMGVDLLTDAGPRSITWDNTFYCYGVELFEEPIANHLRLRPDGPESWSVGDHQLWAAHLGQPIRATSTYWQRLDIGVGRRPDGSVATPATTVDVPVALRLDFPAGAVWFVAAQPIGVGVYVGGDEIMVVFTADKMRAIGFDDDDFLRETQ